MITFLAGFPKKLQIYTWLTFTEVNLNDLNGYVLAKLLGLINISVVSGIGKGHIVDNRLLLGYEYCVALIPITDARNVNIA